MRRSCPRMNGMLSVDDEGMVWEDAMNVPYAGPLSSLAGSFVGFSDV
ncbi:hypothetical protein CEXT_378521, partial [Caerostris extrusa]